MEPGALAPADVDERVVHMVRAACALIIAAERPVTTGDVASLLRQADPDGCALVKMASVKRVIVSLGVRTVEMWDWREISGVWHLGIDYRTRGQRPHPVRVRVARRRPVRLAVQARRGGTRYRLPRLRCLRTHPPRRERPPALSPGPAASSATARCHPPRERADRFAAAPRRASSRRRTGRVLTH
jgi:hypothetical protein